MQSIAVVAAAVTLLLSAGAALAADPPATAAGAAAPQEVGGAKGWTGYSYSEKAGKVCYLIGHPTKSEPANAAKDRTDAMVTERPRANQLNVVNFDAGYAFKDGSDANLDVDGHAFALFTDKQSAWARDSATDKAVTEALAKGKHAVLKGSTAKGAVVTQSYALEGFGDALAAIDKACNIRR
jgi:hypothetical protein